MTSLRIKQLNHKGFLLPGVLAAIIAFSILAIAVGTVVYSNLFTISNNAASQQALNIAESGINYYMWHLNHNNSDFQDGNTGGTQGVYGYGPYIHQYTNSNGVVSGTYSLYIASPSTGSTLTTVRSVGQLNNSNISRTVVAQIGATSFASYSVLSDVALWFGATESANGPVQSNQGVRMDGANSDVVSSANASYVPSLQLGGNGASHPGVWCNSGVTTPVNCNTRNKSSWSYPVTAVDFNQVSGSLCTMKKLAFSSDSTTAALAGQANACSQTPSGRTAAYLPQRSTTYSISRGYLVELNGNTYNLYYVNGETDTLTPYTNALSLTTVATNIALPSTGVLFAEDNVWVRTNGNFNSRISIAAGRLADTNSPNITIADDILYAKKDGSDAIGLVAEGDVDIAPYAPAGGFPFEVDSAILAQAGAVQYEGTYRSNTNRCTRGWTGSNQVFNFYGSVASRQTWTWTWQYNNSCGDTVYDAASGSYFSGVEHNNTTYDYNLLYAPPPGFPITGGYNIISWREVLTHP